MATCNRLDLQTLGSQPIMPQKSPRSLLIGFMGLCQPLSEGVVSYTQVTQSLALNFLFKL